MKQTTAHLLHGRPEGADVGALEARLRRSTRSPDCLIAITSSVQGILAETGGIRPPERRRSRVGT